MIFEKERIRYDTCKRQSLLGMVALLLIIGSPMASLAQPAAPLPPQLFLVDVPAPALTGNGPDWVNTGSAAVPFQKGRVYVVHFWAFGCINCKRNLTYYAYWQSRYAGSPLTVVGVYTPETEKERNRDNVVSEVGAQQITYPVLIDGSGINWRRWQQQIWPTVYLVDKRGHVRCYWLGGLEWQGAGGSRIMDNYIQMLLREPAP